MAEERVAVDVDGRPLSLSNLGKVLWPDGTTKGQYLTYLTRIAPVLLPHLAARPLTMKRYPNGSEGHAFFEKNAPSHTPEWIRRVKLPAPGSTKNRDEITYAVVESLAALVWCGNLAALELHTPQWRVGPRGAPRVPDQIVFDLDPGAPATIVDCSQLALLLRPLLQDELKLGDGELVVKTSGNKGMQVYAPWRAKQPTPSTNDVAKRIAERMEREHPKLVVSRMTKTLREGKVLLDWSQNNLAKTTVSVYSARARDRASVSTPVTWAEVESCAAGNDPLVFTIHEVPDRVDDLGDLFAPLLSAR